jgi:hypothetical protein
MSFLRRQRRKKGNKALGGALTRSAAIRPLVKLRSREEVSQAVSSSDRRPPQTLVLKDKQTARSETKSPPIRRVQISEAVTHPQREARKEPVADAKRALQERVARGRSPGLSR